MIFSISIIDACEFAADMHKYQRRKGYLRIPYINHPIKVCKLIADSGEIETNIMIAALLHDVIEDTNASPTDITERFGIDVTKIVLEVSDNMNLPEMERKELQVIKAPDLSHYAKIIKIADKICNMNETYKDIFIKNCCLVFTPVHTGKIDVCTTSSRFIKINPCSEKPSEIIYDSHHELHGIISLQVKALKAFGSVGCRMCLRKRIACKRFNLPPHLICNFLRIVALFAI